MQTNIRLNDSNLIVAYAVGYQVNTDVISDSDPIIHWTRADLIGLCFDQPSAEFFCSLE